MITINIHEAKANLSRYLAAVEQGNTVVVCKRNVPIAEIRPLPRKPRSRRPIGLAGDKGVKLPDSFFEPLPAELIDAFRGKTR
jgi:prevent-host-death family protein